ncbi:MAG: extracellular solute-binding protein [Anaerolineae bacterium]|nr:extracellular solute-binding protein [Anaerolineae bacterium]MCB0256434.1 extracellular solute-binding protein [Anaerolineae bacterium]
MIAAFLLAACGGSTEPTPAPAAEAPTTSPAVAEEPTAASAAAQPTAAAPASSGDKLALGLWTHSAGNESEMSVITQMVDDFNAKQDQFEVSIEAFPQDSYNDSVAAASVAGSLPCIIDLDQPTVPNFAWSGYIQELPVPDDMLAKFTPGAMGTYKDKVYSLGQFDVALLNYARKSVLEKYDIRIPTVDEPWTLDEFNAAMKTLKDSGEFDYVIDVNAGWTGEWWPYAYSPMLQSFGGDLIDRDTFTTAEDVLNGDAALAWGEWFQSLFADGYANPTPPDDQCFLQGHCALWYTGSWSANDVVKALGDDALFLPAVDFGNGPKIGGGSWQWGISASCDHPDGAWQFIEHVMQPENIALMSQTAGLVPTTAEAAALTENYAEGGPYRVFYEMSNRFGLLRPPTPGYLRLSSEFEQAGIKIRDGNNVQDALDDAVDAINQDIQDNNNYGF